MKSARDNLDLFGWEGPQPAAPAATRSASPTPARPGSSRTGGVAGTDRRDADLLDVVNRGGSGFRRIVLTRNRRVMLSAGHEGTTLRMHRIFLTASDTVLEAAGRFFVQRAGSRARARRVIRQFLAAARPSQPARRRRRREDPADGPLLERLRQEFDRVNRGHFAGELPAVPIFLSRAMRRRNGHFCGNPPEIVISHRLCVAGVPGEAEHTLRHEMIHLWQHATGAALGHGRDFRRWARRLDVHPRATRPVRWREAETAI